MSLYKKKTPNSSQATTQSQKSGSSPVQLRSSIQPAQSQASTIVQTEVSSHLTSSSSRPALHEPSTSAPSTKKPHHTLYYDSDDDDAQVELRKEEPQTGFFTNEFGQELFVDDYTKYQNAGIITSFKVYWPRTARKQSRKKVMIVTFAAPPHAPNGFIIPDLQVTETMDSATRIMDGVKEGDYVEFVPGQHGSGVWVRNDERSALLQEERHASLQAMGKLKQKRVVLNAERIMTSQGLPALFYEFPNLVSPFFRSASCFPSPPTAGKHDSKSSTNLSCREALDVDITLTNMDAVLYGFNLWHKQLMPKLDLASFIQALLRASSDRELVNSLDYFSTQAFQTEIAPRVDRFESQFNRRKALQKRLGMLERSHAQLVNKKLLEKQQLIAMAKIKPDAADINWRQNIALQRQTFPSNISYDDDGNDADEIDFFSSRSAKKTELQAVPIVPRGLKPKFILDSSDDDADDDDSKRIMQLSKRRQVPPPPELEHGVVSPPASKKAKPSSFAAKYGISAANEDEQ